MMKPYPHQYPVSAHSKPCCATLVEAEHLLNPLDTAPPQEFGGPRDQWSPEDLFIGAMADCYVLTFKSLAEARGLKWMDLRCEANGTLDKQEGKVKFVAYSLNSKLIIEDESQRQEAELAMNKAESLCLITNSLNAPIDWGFEISCI